MGDAGMKDGKSKPSELSCAKELPSWLEAEVKAGEIIGHPGLRWSTVPELQAFIEASQRAYNEGPCPGTLTKAHHSMEWMDSLPWDEVRRILPRVPDERSKRILRALKPLDLSTDAKESLQENIDRLNHCIQSLPSTISNLTQQAENLSFFPELRFSIVMACVSLQTAVDFAKLHRNLIGSKQSAERELVGWHGDDPRKFGVWRVLVRNAVNLIEEEVTIHRNDRLETESQFIIVARLLSLLYPGIWDDDFSKNAKLLRDRLQKAM